MLALDHLVYAALDADSAQLKFSAYSKFVTIPGGKHENWGTYNYLSFFANDAYFEWLSLFDERKAKSSANPLIQHTAQQLEKAEEGVIQLAFRTTKLDEYMDYYQKENIPFKGPFEGKRRKPDGTILSWRMLFPINPEISTLPFLIEWGNVLPFPTDKQLINKQHIQQVQWGTEDPEAVKEVWIKLYQLPVPKSERPFSWKLTNSEVALVQGNEINYHISKD